MQHQTSALLRFTHANGLLQRSQNRSPETRSALYRVIQICLNADRLRGSNHYHNLLTSWVLEQAVPSPCSSLRLGFGT